jgi:ribonuclease HI
MGENLSDVIIARRLRRLNRRIAEEKQPLSRSVTAYTDGSYKAAGEHAGGGWAIWVRGMDRRIIRFGPCPAWANDSNKTELCAIWSAVVTATKYLRPEGLHRPARLLVKTDSQANASWFALSKWTEQGDPNINRIIRQCFEACNEANMRLDVRWIKGHTRGGVPQSFINERVDFYANQGRKADEQAGWTETT